MGAIEKTNYLYLNVSCGALVNKQKGMFISAYEGYIVGIREIMDKYENRDVPKVELKIKDNNSDEIAIVKFTKESWYALGFFSRIGKIDIAKPVTIGTMPSKENEKMTFCYLKQAGIEKIEGDKAFPRPGKVKISGKDMLDWAAPFAAMDAEIAKLKTKLPQAAAAPAPAASTEAPITAATAGDDNDLPF